MNFGGTLRLNKFACFTLAFILFLIVYWRSGSQNDPSEASDMVNLRLLLKASLLATERGGKLVADGSSRDLNVKSKGKTKEGANDPVTDADYASHCAMYYSLTKTFPKVTVVSEEHSKDDPSCENQEAFDLDLPMPEFSAIDYMYDEYVLAKDVTIWIDPLDATQEYTEGLHGYVTTMACVAVRGVAVVGVVHFPFSGASLWGWHTKGTSRIHANPHKEDDHLHPRVVISRSHPGAVARLAVEAFGEKASVHQAGGAGYKISAVLNGTYEVYLHATAIKKWDLCAGHALLAAAGGQVTTVKGQPLRYHSSDPVVVTDGVLASRYDHEYYLSKMPAIIDKMH